MAFDPNSALRLRNQVYARKEGSPGFAARTSLLDEAITKSLEKDRKLKKYQTDVGAQTDISTANIGAASRERVADISGGYGIQQEKLQQQGATAREQLTQAGNKVLQELQGNQALERQQASDTSALERVQEAGKQARKTAKQKNQFSQDYLDFVLENLGGSSNNTPYSYNPSGVTDTVNTDIENYLTF